MKDLPFCSRCDVVRPENVSETFPDNKCLTPRIPDTDLVVLGDGKLLSDLRRQDMNSVWVLTFWQVK